MLVLKISNLYVISTTFVDQKSMQSQKNVEYLNIIKKYIIAP